MTTTINNSILPQSSMRIFGLFAAIYLTSYCLIPYVLSITLWPDSAQMFTWSQHFAWGYHEHPWVPPLIIKLFSTLTHYSPLSIFFIGAALNLMACWGVWRLGRKFLPEDCALIAALLLSSYLLASFFLGQINNNTFNFGLWPLMYLCFYNAMTTQKTRHWIAAGVIAGLATLSKYYTLFPIACVGLFILSEQRARQSFSNQGIYWGIVFFLLVLFPHIVWLFNNDFISIRYAFARSESHIDFLSRVYTPILFFISQLGNFFVPLVLIVVMYFSCPRYAKSEYEISSFDKRFVFMTAWGPLLLTLIPSAILGWNLPNEWGQALPCLWGLFFITWLLPKFSQEKFKRQLKIIYFSMFILMFVSILYLHVQSRYKPHIALNYPAAEIAQHVNNQWDAHYNRPLKYIISSDEYIGGVISFYSPRHPDVFSNCNGCLNPVKKWDLEKNGAMVILTNGFGSNSNMNEVIAKMRRAFPNLIVLPVSYFSAKRSPVDASFPKTVVWTAILPPKSLLPHTESQL